MTSENGFHLIILVSLEANMAELKEYVTSLEDEKSQLTAQVMTLQDEAKQWQLRLEQHNQGKGHEFAKVVCSLLIASYLYFYHSNVFHITQ